MESNIDDVIQRVLKDLSVELSDEFDQNFERQAFFAEPWKRHRAGVREQDAHLLVRTGDLRRSVTSMVNGNSVQFYTDLPYARIHNDGGEIIVTARMKRFFRFKFYENCKDIGRKKEQLTVSPVSSNRKGAKTGNGSPRRPLSDGGFYQWTSKMKLSPTAQYWRLMALMPIGKAIKIPRRRFLGYSAEVEKIILSNMERNIGEYFTFELKIKV